MTAFEDLRRLTLDAGSASALFSPDRRYRYLLMRRVVPDELFTVRQAERAVLFVMLNPSTADESSDDPTIRRCIAFAKGWGYTHLLVANLFAWRATDARELANVEDPVGVDNDRVLEALAHDPDRLTIAMTVAAWGVHERLRGLVQARADHVVQVLRPLAPRCFALAGSLQPTKGYGRQPKHPLARGRERIPDDAPLFQLEALYEGAS